MFSPQKHRAIPTVMATQHPDNAGTPFWHNDPFIGDQHETQEMYENFKHVGCDEYMWDWEGKFADEAMIEKLMGQYLEFFKKHQVGKDIFITVRVPNVWEETSFKLARAYMSVLSGADLTNTLGLNSPPVFEFILPMTKRADQLIHIQDTFQKTAKLKQEIFGDSDSTPAKKTKPKGKEEGYIHIIPLFESVDDLADCGKLLEEYLSMHQKLFKKLPVNQRAFIARSDPALNAGFVPAVLATRMALREFYRIAKKYKTPIYPIIGTGSLPFRGGVNPENIKNTLKQYEGVKTVTIQSAFRYDYPLPEVKKAIKYIQKELEHPHVLEFSDEEFKKLRQINDIFKKIYGKVIEEAADHVNEMAAHMPRRRSRVLHIGLFGYNRGVGKTKLPRAISFTGAWYSMGIPPEFIGTGRGLKKIKEMGLLPLLEKHFFTLRSELVHAGKYLNMDNLERLATQHSWAKDILADVTYISEILDIPVGPQKEHHFIHKNLTSIIMLKRSLKQDFTRELVEAGVMRKSLG
jgi:phosphoenolpyruvate carboxylase